MPTEKPAASTRPEWVHSAAITDVSTFQKEKRARDQCTPATPFYPAFSAGLTCAGTGSPAGSISDAELKSPVGVAHSWDTSRRVPTRGASSWHRAGSHPWETPVLSYLLANRLHGQKQRSSSRFSADVRGPHLRMWGRVGLCPRMESPLPFPAILWAPTPSGIIFLRIPAS